MIPGETILSRRAMGMKDDPHAGEFKVIQSLGSGLFYVGTMMLSCGKNDCEDCSDYDREKGAEIDYNSRETDYFSTREEAGAALRTYKETGFLPKQRT